MPTHAEQRVLPYTPEQLFALVADIERYPEFLPWCVGARIRERQPHLDRRRSDHRLQACFASALPRAWRSIRRGGSTSTYAEGPFRYLNNHWVFEPVPGGCRIDFFVDFEFKSRLMQKVIEMLFSEAVRRMVGAFEKRARDLYGFASPGSAREPAA